MARNRSDGNSGSAGSVQFLDMGHEKYGDSIVCLFGDKTILFDGGHARNIEGRDGFSSIPEQIETRLGPTPFKLDLLVTTHAHGDHIGCLPAMVAKDLLSARWALVADERLEFCRAPDEGVSDSPNAGDRLAAALREEDHSHLDDDVELERFIEDTSLETRYKDMLAALARSGTKIVRFGRDDCSALEAAFATAGLLESPCDAYRVATFT